MHNDTGFTTAGLGEDSNHTALRTAGKSGSPVLKAGFEFPQSPFFRVSNEPLGGWRTQ